MFGSKKPQNRIDSLIGAGTLVEGNVTFSGGLRVDGRMKGNVVASGDEPGTLVVAEGARIEGEVRVSQVVINGTVVGPVHSDHHVELQAKANVTGDVHYRSLEMQVGAILQGRLVYVPEGASDKVIPLKPVAAD